MADVSQEGEWEGKTGEEGKNRIAFQRVERDR